MSSTSRHHRRGSREPSGTIHIGRRRSMERSADRSTNFHRYDNDVEMRPVYRDRDRDCGRNSLSVLNKNSTRITKRTSSGTLSKDEMRALLTSEPKTVYFRVEILYGFLLGKNAALDTIKEYLKPQNFHPYRVMFREKSFVFLVDDIEVAKKLIDGSGNIKFPGGRRLDILVSKFNPRVNMNDFTMKTLISVVKRRLDTENHILDLSHFQHDKEFLTKRLLCPLHDRVTLDFISDLLCELGVARDITCLYLGRNNFNELDDLKSLISKLPSLQAIHLEYNRIDSMERLYSIKNRSIQHLNLHGNPFLVSDNHPTYFRYVRDLRVYFPFLKTLDGAPTSETMPENLMRTRTSMDLPSLSSTDTSGSALSSDASTTSSSSSSASHEFIDEMERKVKHVCIKTGMNQKYSKMCLEQCGWDINLALTRFHSVIDRIPCEAFESTKT
ncbi:Nuclear RNA export factor [Nesidiocoris tenuis]|uniref:Nuclear RNA export factor n=1 Tax=Nesidiocoris tenuis TaxID=355587 RepID=A0ABN7AKM3_9HEMI|nr:Nuclear RNA export factor [Nesidiocoris tenuis]